jgi:hypothetical protein
MTALCRSRRNRSLYLALLLATFLSNNASAQERIPDSSYAQAVPRAVRGPFISDPEIVTALDCPTEACDGAFSFSRLMEARVPVSQRPTHGGNPFNLHVARQVLATIKSDLTEIRRSAHATEGQLSENFLTDEGSRVELVGIVNRMDRQFIKDRSVGLSLEQQNCGEISLIYRFSYSIRHGKQHSRLPVTMNLVFPALPFDNKKGQITCRAMAKRWLNEVERPDGRPKSQILTDLLDPANGPLATIDGRDMLRLEINMQAYRKSAGNDSTDFGTEAAYILRVFRWDPQLLLFMPSYLGDQIDRNKVLGSKTLREALVSFLSKPDSVASIDAGTLDIPFDLHVLAYRAVSISPGGGHRSANHPFWNATDPKEQIISDDEIKKAVRPNMQLSFVKSVDDFRLRLNEQSCTGCHQTRAIAGFHFPGADRVGTPTPNAVFLPGSPQFYGDQPRRMEILRRMASTDAKLSEYQLASGYADRPMNRFAAALSDTQLIGGWGGACLADEVIPSSQRKWTCKEELRCRPLFASSEDAGRGTCVPKRTEIGDPLQEGDVKTSAFGNDQYKRTKPEPVTDDTRILPKALPQNPPADNEYYGAHQEYYPGDPDSSDRVKRRDAKTGGFPAGMLRLSECVGLPQEASCGLIASSGFNDCIPELSSNPDLSIEDCFTNFTSYAGIRACTAASPCRDDYICVRPMGYHPDNAIERYNARRNALSSSHLFWEINHRRYDPSDFGQKQPDATWISRDDQRGLCIPPYFVFQFRSDGHPAP